MTELIRRIDPQRFTVHVVVFRKVGGWLPRIAAQAASIVEFPLDGFARLGTLVQLLRFARWCRRERIAIVQTCDFYANVFGLPGAFLGGVPVRIGSRRELNPDKSAARIRLQRLAYRFATRIVANSPAAREILISEGVRAARVSLIANGIDADGYRQARAERPVRTLISVANLRPEKSHETLIAAAAQLTTAHPELRIQIVGDGARRAELEAFARARVVAGSIEFLGHREDVPALLAAADAFVLTSRSEACPNCAIEAMASGLPVVASAVGGLLDLIVSGSTGLLVSPGDVDGFATAISSLVQDPARARAIGQAAQDEVRGRYSYEQMVRAFEDLYAAGLEAVRHRGSRVPRAAADAKASLRAGI